MCGWCSGDVQSTGDLRQALARVAPRADFLEEFGRKRRRPPLSWPRLLSLSSRPAPLSDQPFKLVGRDQTRSPRHLDRLDDRQHSAVESGAANAERFSGLRARIHESLDPARLAHDYRLCGRSFDNTGSRLTRLDAPTLRPTAGHATRSTVEAIWGRRPRRLREITRETIDTYAAQLRVDGAGAPTVNRTLGLLQGVFHRAVEWRRLGWNPVVGVRRVAHTRAETIDARTPETVEAIRAKLDPQNAALVGVLAYEGCGLPRRTRSSGVTSSTIAAGHAGACVSKIGRAHV